MSGDAFLASYPPGIRVVPQHRSESGHLRAVGQKRRRIRQTRNKEGAEEAISFPLDAGQFVRLGEGVGQLSIGGDPAVAVDHDGVGDATDSIFVGQ